MADFDKVQVLPRLGLALSLYLLGSNLVKAFKFCLICCAQLVLVVGGLVILLAFNTERQLIPLVVTRTMLMVSWLHSGHLRY